MKKVYTILATALLATLFSGQVMGQATFTSSKSDKFQLSGTWTRTSGSDADGIPDADDAVIISNDHEIVVETTVACSSIVFASGTKFSKLTLNGTGANLSVSGTITVNATTTGSDDRFVYVGDGNLTIGSLIMQGTGGSKDIFIQISKGSMSVNGNITGNDPSKCVIQLLDDGILSIGDQLTLTSVIFSDPVKGTINYTSTQSSQNVLGGTYSKLEISGSGTKTVLAPITVNELLTLTSGYLSTSTTNLLTLGSSADVSGASAASFVTGPIAKIGSGAFTFPVGKAGRYAPITIGSSTSSTTYTAEYFRADPGTQGLPLTGGASNPNVVSVSRAEYWRLSAASPRTVSVSVAWNAGSVNSSTPNLLRLVKSTSSSTPITWSSFTAAASTTSSGTSTAGSLTANSVSIGTTGFFAFGSTTSNAFAPLPVTFGAIKAFEKETGVQVDWTSYSEQNLANYQVERSADGIHFTSIGEVAPRNVTDATNYNFFDAMPLSGTSFYRIRNNDIDGKSGLSTIVKVNLNKNIKTISVYPNPVRGNRVSFQTSDLAKGLYNVEVYNTMGSRVFSQALNHAGGAITQALSLPTLQSGSYTLRINGTSSSSIHKITILQ